MQFIRQLFYAFTIAFTAENSYTIQNLSANTEYGFIVSACVNDVWSELNESDVIYITIGSYTLSGSISSFGSDSDKALVELLDSNGIVPFSSKETNTYSFEGLDNGQYTLRVSKTKHCTRDYSITIDGDDAAQDVEILLYGDVTGNGTVDAKDATQILKWSAGLVSMFDNDDDETRSYRLSVANVSHTTENPSAKDATQILRYANMLTSLIDMIA